MWYKSQTDTTPDKNREDEVAFLIVKPVRAFTPVEPDRDKKKLIYSGGYRKGTRYTSPS